MTDRAARIAIPVVFVLIWSTGFIVAKAVLPHARTCKCFWWRVFP